MREQVDPLKARLTTSALAKVYFYLKYIWSTHLSTTIIRRNVNLFTFVVKADN